MFDRITIKKYDSDNINGSTLIIGKSKSGKTMLVESLLKKYVKPYDSVSVFSPCATSLDYYNDLPMEVHIYIYDEERVKKIMDIQEHSLMHYGLAQRKYLIFEDANSLHSDFFFNLFGNKCVEYNIVPIFVSQMSNIDLNNFDRLFTFTNDIFYKQTFNRYCGCASNKLTNGEIIGELLYDYNCIVIGKSGARDNPVILPEESVNLYYYNSSGNKDETFVILYDYIPKNLYRYVESNYVADINH